MENIFSFGLEGDELHQKLGGGLPKNSIMLIEGPMGLGKSIMAQRITYGVLVNNISVSYLSTELSVVSFLNQMESLKYDIKDKFFSGYFKVVSLFSPLREIDFEENLIDKFVKARELFESDVVVIDTLNDVLFKKDGLKECLDLINTFKKIVGMGKSIVICVDPESLNDKMFSLLKGVCEVHIALEERELYGNKMSYIVVRRFNCAQGEVEKEIPFKVRAGIGIVVELASQ